MSGAWMQGHKNASRHAETQRPRCCFSSQIAMRRNPETATPLKQGGNYLCWTVIMLLFGKEEKGYRQSKFLVSQKEQNIEMGSSTGLGWYGKFTTIKKVIADISSISPSSKWIVKKRGKIRWCSIITLLDLEKTIC